MGSRIVHRSRHWALLMTLAAVGFLGWVVAAERTSAGGNDPSPSPLFEQGLADVIGEFSVQSDGPANRVPARRHAPAISINAGRPGTVGAQGAVLSSGTAATQSLEYDCFQSSASLRFNTDPIDQQCLGPQHFAQANGPTMVSRAAPPYTTGVDIPIEILSMTLTGNSDLGPIVITERPDMASTGMITNVVADGGGNFVSGNSFFDVFVEIDLPGLGLAVNTGNQPVHVKADGITALPPIGSTFSTTPGQTVPLLDAHTGQPLGWLCSVDHTPTTTETCVKFCIYKLTCIQGDAGDLAASGLTVGDLRKLGTCVNTCPDLSTVADFDGDGDAACMLWKFIECAPTTLPDVPGATAACVCDTTKYCIYKLTCISGHPSDVAAVGLVVGDKRKHGTCVNTCPEEKSWLPTRHGQVCMWWSPIDCAPSQLADIPGTFGSCPCEPTMGNTVSCSGYSTCPTVPSCPYYASCEGYVSCPAYPSCPSRPYAPTMVCYPSCPIQNCPTYDQPSCRVYPSCPYYPSCYGTPTCEGAITCTGAPPPFASSTYPVVFSVEGVVNPAEGLKQPDPGHPAPNDVYALGFAGPWGYQTEGELFQSSGATLGAPPDLTNVDRISAALGVGPTAAGPYHGPFAPNPGAPDPAPPSPGSAVGALGLQHGDNIDALSFGRDGGRVLLFSVDPGSAGVAGSAVHVQATLSPVAGPVGTPPPSNGGGDPGNEAAGDIFRSAQFASFGGPSNVTLLPAPMGSNTLDIDELALGLQAPAHNYNALTDSVEDDIDALEATDAKEVDSDGDGIPEDADSAVYFSLNVSSTTVITGALATPDDILVSPPPGGAPMTFGVYADGVADIGLLAGDDLDAVCVWDTPPRGSINTGDEILFSLRSGSPSLGAGANPNMPGPGPFSAADVFRKPLSAAGGGLITMYATHTALGLLTSDELDALDIGRCDCRFDSDNSGLGDVCEPGFTDIGTNVAVTLSPCVAVAFDSVALWGISAVSVSGSGPTPPAGYSILPICIPSPMTDRANGSSSVPGYADVHTTAVLGAVNPGPPQIDVCIDVETTAVNGPGQNCKMFHYEEISQGNFQWVDVTTSVGPGGGCIHVCGRVNSLSTFIVAEPTVCACDCPADPKCDGITDILDVVNCVNVAFRGGAAVLDPNAACPVETTDTDCSGFTDVLDVVHMVNVAFRAGNPATEFCNPCP